MASHTVPGLGAVFAALAASAVDIGEGPGTDLSGFFELPADRDGRLLKHACLRVGLPQ
ncbi:hypothetical protein GCM10011588_51730 [Nocardia jinanensis]|uniref:Uncharacterized protein n=1 Tax=Nocardia jinanensis TaxID=382504 RepID=A0A917VW03_9NOCA|nr:hypothetical protein GCM10011588_51730 [Nocardia jinanensis]